MSRFIKETDYGRTIKAEIKTMVAGNNSVKQYQAEDTAIATIREYIGGRYDCDAIFIPHTGDGPDTRNLHIVKCVIVLALYDLYHQTGSRDIPEHRKDDNDDVIMWLKDAGRGTIKTTLPPLSDEQDSGDIRFNSKKQRTHRW